MGGSAFCLRDLEGRSLNGPSLYRLNGGSLNLGGD